jgi:dihydropyrimidinase
LSGAPIGAIHFCSETEICRLAITGDEFMSSQLDLVIRNATAITATDSMRCDIGVCDGKITALADNLPEAHREIDAAGFLVLPGGIDSHCHIEQRSSTGLITADDFFTAGIAAACGGTTTLMPFVAPHRGQSLRNEFRRYLDRARQLSVVDFAFHIIVSDPTESMLEEELPEVIRQGCPSFKVYMTYDALKLTDRQILDVLALAKSEKLQVMVHAENSDAISWLTERLIREGKTTPRYHAVSRPQIVEREATHRIITLAELIDVPILIVHVSAKDALEQIQWARDRGRRVYAETCPQYLALSSEDLERPGFEGAKFICSPPLRDPADQAAIWDALASGLVQVFSSDHAPYRYQDPQGKQANGCNAPFNKVPNGMPGLETRLPILFSEGVNRGRIGIHTFVALAATNAAKLYGLYPRKGTIAVGSDADIVIWDPEREMTIHKDMLHDTMDYTPFECMQIKGWPITTISRGEILWTNGTVHANAGRGQFIGRQPGDSTL